MNRHNISPTRRSYAEHLLRLEVEERIRIAKERAAKGLPPIDPNGFYYEEPEETK